MFKSQTTGPYLPKPDESHYGMYPFLFKVSDYKLIVTNIYDHRIEKPITYVTLRSVNGGSAKNVTQKPTMLVRML